MISGEFEIASPTEKDDEFLAMHEALDDLAAHDNRKAELIKLHDFVGLKIDEAANVLKISAPTAKRDWAYARACLNSRSGTESQGERGVATQMSSR